MKRNLLFLLITLVLVMSCASEEDRIEQKVKELAEPAALSVVKGIKKQVEEIVSAQGPIEAISFCSVHAVPITDTLSKAMSDGLDIKRTSVKFRNPYNAPDEFEQKALDYFKKEFSDNGTPPAYFIQKVKRNNKDFYDYYKPLAIQGSCLTCHAEKEIMETALVEILDRNYPGDRATGYETGDFRGAIRVAVPVALVSD